MSRWISMRSLWHRAWLLLGHVWQDRWQMYSKRRWSSLWCRELPLSSLCSHSRSLSRPSAHLLAFNGHGEPYWNSLPTRYPRSLSIACELSVCAHVSRPWSYACFQVRHDRTTWRFSSLPWLVPFQRSRSKQLIERIWRCTDGARPPTPPHSMMVFLP